MHKTRYMPAGEIKQKWRCLLFSVFSWMVPCCYPHFLFDRSRAAVISPAVNVSNQDCLLWEHHICNWFIIGATKPDILKLQCCMPVSAIFENRNIPRISISHLLLRVGIVGGVEYDNNNKRVLCFCLSVWESSSSLSKGPAAACQPTHRITSWKELSHSTPTVYPLL